MSKKVKRFLSIALALTLCLSLSNSVFAKDINNSESMQDKEVIGEYTFEVSGDGSITPMSSVSGYGQKTVSAVDSGIIVDCNSQGIGGMGITIETSCSAGNFTMNYLGSPYIGAGSDISGEIGSNDHIERHNLWQSGLQEYLISFKVPSGVSMLVKVWIYG